LWGTMEYSLVFDFLGISQDLAYFIADVIASLLMR
jgi:hypothetical protein